MKAVTFNIRCVWSGDETNAFIHRAGLIYDKIKSESPDIVAFQEITSKHLDLLEKLMPDYVFIGHGRDASFTGEGLYTAYKKSEFILSASEVFWLSPQIYVPESRFEDQSDCPRICTYTLLYHRTSGKMIRVYNIHLDHKGEGARRLGMQCVLARIAEDNAKMPAGIILLGDFNAHPKEEAISICNSFNDPQITDVTGKFDITFHDFGRYDPPEKIDYIYLSNDLLEKVTDVSRWEDENCGIWLSDHFPIAVTFDEF